jgi:hypothetical protein
MADHGAQTDMSQRQIPDLKPSEVGVASIQLLEKNWQYETVARKSMDALPRMQYGELCRQQLLRELWCPAGRRMPEMRAPELPYSPFLRFLRRFVRRR